MKNPAAGRSVHLTEETHRELADLYRRISKLGDPRLAQLVVAEAVIARAVRDSAAIAAAIAQTSL
ncbi:MAG TPA: hypothetical protein VF746_28130 [Longimicrobium sp.]|jgi:hypothetical protein